jgi:hypothetical protein
MSALDYLDMPEYLDLAYYVEIPGRYESFLTEKNADAAKISRKSAFRKKFPLSQIDWEGSVLRGRQHEQCELRHSLSKGKGSTDSY